ncbi:Pentatricopeptide repeat [Dillenia turbinata]|uniref:Pentatricopeptide repeat n=1 Tax=Dillenia turbinata TaxID=194707 RepID=A0AAN8Z3K6_9MAGN
MFIDAKALLESLVSNNSNNSSKFMVVDTKLDTFKVCELTLLVFDLVVQTYSKLRMFEIGFNVYCYLEGYGCCLNVKTFNTLIYFVKKSDGYFLVWRIYEHMVNTRVYPNEEIMKSMVIALCKEGKLKQYIEVLDRIHRNRCSPMMIVNTSLMFKMFEVGKVEKGLVLMKRLLQEKHHSRHHLLHIEPYNETFDYLITGYTRNGKLRETVMCCDEMTEGGLITVEKISKAGDVKEANALLTHLLDRGFILDRVTYYHLMNGYGREGEIQEILMLYCELENSSSNPGQLAFSSLIKNLCHCKAEKYLMIMKTQSLDPSLCTYDSLITGHFLEGQQNKSLFPV